jgi:hypothetical protein
MTTEKEFFLQKYRALIPYLEATYYRVRLLISTDIKEDIGDVDDFVCLMMQALISEAQDFGCAPSNITLTEELVPGVKQLLESFNKRLQADLPEDESTVVD